ncbi:TPA: hypothetical protein ACGA5D_003518 [Enterococcus faecalis]
MTNNVDFLVHHNGNNGLILSNFFVLSNGETEMKLACLADLPALIELRWLERIEPLDKQYEGVPGLSLNVIDVVLADGIDIKEFRDQREQLSEDDDEPENDNIPVLVLYDPRRKVYLCESEVEGEATTTPEEALAWRVSGKELTRAWHVVYKAAKLGIGNFFVYGIKE